MLQVFRFPVPVDVLKKMSNEERTFFLLMGHAENQIFLMYKMVRFSSNFESEEEITQLTSSNQTQVLLRLLIAIIYETWVKLIKERFLERANVSITLSDNGNKALTELRSHFSSSALLGKIRNSFAFHYPDDEYMSQAFKAAGNDELVANGWNWYVSAARTNTCYYASELVLLHAIMKAAGGLTLQEAQKKLMREAFKVHGLLCDLFDDIMRGYMEKYFVGHKMLYRVGVVPDTANLDQFALPLYAHVEEADGPIAQLFDNANGIVESSSGAEQRRTGEPRPGDSP